MPAMVSDLGDTASRPVQPDGNIARADRLARADALRLATRPVLRNLQGLRATAAVLVMFVHLDRLLALAGLPKFGGGGVDLFFVISGFIMVYTTQDRRITPWAFVKDRIARIVPPYWAMTLLVFAIALASPRLLQATHANLADLGRSLTFVPFVKSNGLTEPILFVGWTLNYEMFFYLLFAIGLTVPDRRAGIAGVLLALCGLVLAGAALHPHGVAARFYTNKVLLDFAAGILIGLVYDRAPISTGSRLAVAAGSLVCMAWLFLLPLVGWPVPFLRVSCLPATGVVGGALMLERCGWRIRSDVVLRLGGASYAIYLVHPFVTQTGQKLAAILYLGRTGAMLLLAATVTAACLTGLLVHRWIERPLTFGVRRMLHPRQRDRQVG